MTCRHCGKEYADEYKYCPYCAEPRVRVEQHKTLDEMYVCKKVNTARFWSIAVAVLLQIFALIIMGPLLGLAFGVLVFPMCIWTIIYRVDKDAKEAVAKNSRETIIDKQFIADQTSICPNCGSHNIKVYRKGYDYRPGFWGSIFGVRGAGYVGGFDANTACCRCLNCGNDWATDYDYRLINK